MASALWIGEKLRRAEQLIPLLHLPVREILLPFAEDDAERLCEPAFCGPVTAVTTAGERHFWHLPLCTPAALHPLLGYDHYFLAMEDFSPAAELITKGKGRLLALGERKPPTPVEFRRTAPEKIFAALCKALPSVEPAAFYFTGGIVRSSIEDEDYSALLERMRGR